MTHRYERLTPHVFIMHAEHETDRPILAAISGERRTLLMDAGNSSAHAELFRAELAKRGIRPPDMMVLTHWHWDHTFGMPAWDGIPAAAHAETGRALAALEGMDGSDAGLDELVRKNIISESSAADIRKEYGEQRSSIRIIQPDLLFQDRIELDLGGVVCELVHMGGDHSADCCYLHVREDKVLFLGDALGPAVYGGPRRYTSGSFLRLLAGAYAYGADWYVESHGLPMNGPEFRRDLEAWEQLAMIAREAGPDRERVIREMKASLKTEELPDDLMQGVGYFLEGFKSR
ncbi:MBL fold metallo-hydrolase [Paenibacillus sp. HN-1]|uniref:MBL fold metallo-hydrolase n=1 Tax=Paenibacillus TaxID=44249 RepID=UPI001CA9D17C|nr:MULTISPECIES: MBL fold metallo-hydrolase [Paenibacillus]MBY9078751.1 MBL fold metallo-hydrolase [Paenibacillus sp. CGMCC 1.18879]MBY9088089.1 MBL fold metallo-hydrolase [Paenibacillus sinensis]